jgi:hypothetical protein
MLYRFGAKMQAENLLFVQFGESPIKARVPHEN